MKEQLSRLETAGNLWGINPEAVFIFTSDIEQGTNDLDNMIRLETLHTNISQDAKTYRESLRWFTEYLGLLDEKGLTPLGKITLIESNPGVMMQACLIAKDYKIRSLVADILSKNIKQISPSELETYFPDESSTYRKLLISFRFLEFKGKSITPDFESAKIGKIMTFPKTVENWICGKTLVQAFVGKDDEVLSSTVTSELLNILDVTFQTTRNNAGLVEAIVHVGNAVNDTLENLITDPEPILTALKNTLEKYSEENKSIAFHVSDSDNQKSKYIKISRKTLPSIADKYDVEIEKLESLVNQLTFLQCKFPRIYMPYASSITGLAEETLTRVLGEIFDENIRIDSHFIRFTVNLRTEGHKGDVGDYLNFIFKTYSKNEERISKLESACKYLTGEWSKLDHIIERNVCIVKSDVLQRVLNRRFSPFSFVYTLPNPANLGKEVIGKYTNKSEILRREVDKLSEKWPSIKTESSYSYTDMTDRLFAKGIVANLSVKEIRIMTPYTDYELKKYVSILRTLVTKGYELRVLSRLPVDSEPWNVFKESLLKGLGEKARAVKVRTYTRYKEFLPLSKLTRTNKGGRKEFGVHAKLFIIGDSKDGALLLGSANLLENSFSWNPECGLYTEDEKFIESAKTFFDFVWDLCENDALDFSALDRVPKGPFFPRVYHY